MCGITGKVPGSVRVDEELLTRMCSVIEHRGPGSRGVLVEDGVGLGIQRLRIIGSATRRKCRASESTGGDDEPLRAANGYHNARR